jgi:hypothetical protein
MRLFEGSDSQKPLPKQNEPNRNRNAREITCSRASNRCSTFEAIEGARCMCSALLSKGPGLRDLPATPAETEALRPALRHYTQATHKHARKHDKADHHCQGTAVCCTSAAATPACVTSSFIHHSLHSLTRGWRPESTVCLNRCVLRGELLWRVRPVSRYN